MREWNEQRIWPRRIVIVSGGGHAASKFLSSRISMLPCITCDATSKPAFDGLRITKPIQGQMSLATPSLGNETTLKRH